MQRIIIIGCPGSGKTTLATKLQKLLHIELFHLDQYFWQPYWIESDKQTFNQTVKSITEKESWIIDGNYRRTLELRIEKADTIIYLNYPTIVCLARAIKRIIRHWGKVRYELPEGCVERIDVGFLYYIIRFKDSQGNKIVKEIRKMDDEKNIYIFRNDEEVSRFLLELNSEI